jgi:hypothetical protein
VLFGKGLRQVSSLYVDGKYLGKCSSLKFDVETTDKDNVVTMISTPTGAASHFYEKYMREYEGAFSANLNACSEVPIQHIPDLPDTLEGRVRHWIKYPTDHVPVARRWICKDGELGADMSRYNQNSTLPNMICSTLIKRITEKRGLNITPRHYRTAILSRIQYGIYLMALFIGKHEAGCILPDSYLKALGNIQDCDIMFAQNDDTFGGAISKCIIENSDFY